MSGGMRTASLIIVVALSLAPVAATAQTWTHNPHPGQNPARNPGASMAEQHRWEMERLRAEADRQAAFAARQQLETQLALMRLEAARQASPAPVSIARTAGATPPFPAQAGPTSQTRIGAASQIDAWLDRATPR